MLEQARLVALAVLPLELPALAALAVELVLQWVQELVLVAGPRWETPSLFLQQMMMCRLLLHQ